MTGRASTSPGIVDCDIHPHVNGGLETLFPYLAEGSRQALDSRKGADPFFSGGPWSPPHLGGGTLRADTVPPSGGLPASDPHYTATDLLDTHGIEIGILLPFQPARLCLWGDADEAAILATAYNSFFVDHWLEADGRYRLAIVVAPHDPLKAAAEIRRHADTKGVVAVWLPRFTFDYGYRYYDPVYAAAAETGLPIVSHTGPDVAVARPGHASGTEGYSAIPALGITQLASLIFEGAMSRFPDLQFVFVEYGWTWVPSMLWRMDAAWKAGRRTSPWVTQAPSEIVRERIRFTSEPAAEAPNEAIVGDVLRQMHAESTLMYSSDYPHWDSDFPSTVFTRVDESLRRRIFRENAVETFGARLGASNQGGAP